MLRCGRRALGSVHSQRSPGLTCPIAHKRTIGTGFAVFCVINMHKIAVSPGLGITDAFASTIFILTSAIGLCLGITGQFILDFW